MPFLKAQSLRCCFGYLNCLLARPPESGPGELSVRAQSPLFAAARRRVGLADDDDAPLDLEPLESLLDIFYRVFDSLKARER